MSHKLTVKLFACKESLDFSLGGSEEQLLFIHGSAFLSSQWPLDRIGVQVLHEGTRVRLNIMGHGGEAFQGWNLEVECFQELVDWFRARRYPVHNPDPRGFAKTEGQTH